MRYLLYALLFCSSAIVSCQQKHKGEKHGEGHEHHAEIEHKAHGDNKDEEKSSVGFKDSKLKAAFDQYVVLRKALTESDEEKAKQAASTLLTLINQVEEADKAGVAAAIISNSSDVEQQRKAFFDLSNEMTTLVRSSITQGELYLAYCPMAFDNTGASWITTEKEIRNPYFGDKMMKCGLIKETLK